MSMKKRALSLVLCLVMVFSLLTIIPVTSVAPKASAATTGVSVTVPNVWSARKGVSAGNTYGIGYPLNSTTARMLTLSGNNVGYKDIAVTKGSIGLPYFVASDISANAKWTTSYDGGWYWRNGSNNYYLCFNYTGAGTGLHDTFKITGQSSQPKNSGTLSGWYTFKNVSTVNANSALTRVYYGGDASNKVLSWYAAGGYWTAVNTDGAYKDKATNTNIFQKQDLTASIAITGASVMVNGTSTQYRFSLTDDLGGVNHTATGNTASMTFPGYTYGSNRSVTWESSNPDVAAVSSTGLVTAKANGTANIKVSFKWTEAGTEYELTNSLALTVKVPDYTYTNENFNAPAYVATKTLTAGNEYVISNNSAATDGNEGIVTNALTLIQSVNSTGTATVERGVLATGRPYIRYNIQSKSGTQTGTIDNNELWRVEKDSDGNYYKNVSGSKYLSWYYPWNANSPDEFDVKMVSSKPRGSGVATMKDYTFNETRDYAFLTGNGKDIRSGNTYSKNNSIAIQYGGEHVKVLGWNGSQWRAYKDSYTMLTVFEKGQVTASLNVSGTKSGIRGDVLTLNAALENEFRYGDPNSRVWWWTSDDENIASIVGNPTDNGVNGSVANIRLNNTGTTTLWANFMWRDSVTGETYLLQRSVTITVQKSYVVSYDANGGDGSMASQTVVAGNRVILSTNAFTGPDSDAEFVGWSTSANGEDVYAPGASYEPTEDVTMYAIWGYEVTFRSNDYLGETDGHSYTKVIRADGLGTVVSNSEFYSNGSGSINTVASDIIGWSSKRSGEPEIPANTGKLTLSGPLTLYAQWKYDNTGNAVLDSTTYPIFITCIEIIDGNYPTEPMVASGYNWNSVVKSADGTISASKGVVQYADKAGSIVKSDIFSSPAFMHSNNEGGTWGVAFASVEGVNYEPIQYINTNTANGGVDWEAIKVAFLSDSNRGYNIPASDYDKYELIPYVVKLQHGTSAGWHVDCYLHLKDNVRYSYDVGLDRAEFSITGAMPNGGNVLKNQTLENVPAYPSDVTVYDSYGEPVTFLGYQCSNGKYYEWNAAAQKFVDPDDPTGTSFISGFTFEEDTLFTAVWKTNPASLILTKTVETASGSDYDADSGKLFDLNIKLDLSSLDYVEIPYAVYNSSNELVYSDTINVTAENQHNINIPVQLGNGYRVVVKQITIDSTYAITETPVEGYTLSAGSNVGLSGSFEGGPKTVRAVNTYNSTVTAAGNVVIDFGLPVKITLDKSASGISANKPGVELKTGITAGDEYSAAKSAETKFGISALNGNILTYTPNKIALEKDTVYYSVKVDRGYKYFGVDVIPAADVYYEDSFVDYKGNWTNVGNSYTGEIHSGDGNDVYGYDKTYGEYTQYSLGAAHKVTVSGSETATATFTFTGTGFELYSACTSERGGAVITVKNQDGTQIGMKKLMSTVATGEYWQTPVHMQELAYGTYTVEVKVAYSSILDPADQDGNRTGSVTFVLDGVRIYNTEGTYNDQYAADEQNAQFISVRKQLISKNSFSEGNTTGAVFLDGHIVLDENGKAKYESAINTDNVEDYKNFGPKNEVYLSVGQAVAFRIDAYSGENLQLGLKAANLNRCTVTVNGVSIDVSGNTAMYYSIRSSDGIVVIANNSDGLVSITNLKLSGAAAPAMVRTLSVDDEVVSYAATMMMSFGADPTPSEEPAPTDEPNPSEDPDPTDDPKPSDEPEPTDQPDDGDDGDDGDDDNGALTVREKIINAVRKLAQAIKSMVSKLFWR